MLSLNSSRFLTAKSNNGLHVSSTETYSNSPAKIDPRNKHSALGTSRDKFVTSFFNEANPSQPRTQKLAGDKKLKQLDKNVFSVNNRTEFIFVETFDFVQLENNLCEFQPLLTFCRPLKSQCKLKKKL